MSFLQHLNFFTTIATFGCVSFAASNFGVKLGKISGNQNTLGYKYISESEHKDKLYESIIKTSNPTVAKTAEELKNWCNKYEKSPRYWKDTSKYCLIKNNIRHQLISKGFTIKNPLSQAVEKPEEMCTDALLDSYSDSNHDSATYLFAKSRCVDTTKPPAAAAAKR
ncbi:hypothetical protein A6V39_01020 [Candidatus Mycoplasma haematobovis]|uniref:Uncharacterized protein n=1 Tax=Candidatus Mycoplasma haematobovis TaxID=432608 RepID=A0A1A9QES6_9MOLU|nr:hypothetical protein [Candidatus Mycoplasma haematobovis]OAL10634.1 hypothetical protein A6V39_01020 [Candidatus Mycoplasma haematobovis]